MFSPSADKSARLFEVTPGPASALSNAGRRRRMLVLVPALSSWRVLAKSSRLTQASQASLRRFQFLNKVLRLWASVACTGQKVTRRNDVDVMEPLVLRMTSAADEILLSLVVRSWCMVFASSRADRQFSAAESKTSEVASAMEALRTRASVMLSFTESSLVAMEMARFFQVWRGLARGGGRGGGRAKLVMNHRGAEGQAELHWVVKELFASQDLTHAWSFFLAWKDHVNQQAQVDTLAAEAHHVRMAVQEDLDMLEDQCRASGGQLDDLQQEFEELTQHLGRSGLRGRDIQLQELAFASAALHQQTSLVCISDECNLQTNELMDLEQEVRMLEQQLGRRKQLSGQVA